jgi:hypothetical protein
MKSFFAVLVLAAVAGVVPQGNAQVTLKVMMSGASGAWQAMALGTYKAGHCPTGSTGFCGHASFGKVSSTDNRRFTLRDTRPGILVPGTADVTDTGDTWIVWNFPGGSTDPCTAHVCNVWAYTKVDSIVGDRCYFANPRCFVQAPASFPAPSKTIAIWNKPVAEQAVPAIVQALFTGSGHQVNAAVSEVRPEDALFGQCRINSDLGGDNDGLGGLGYNGAAIPSGTCPAFGATLSQLSPPFLASSQSTSTAHPMAFNISGTDPFTNNAIPAYSTVQVGAYPLIFITHRAGAMANVKDANLSQLQNAFSGANCQANNFTGGTAAGITVFIREPLSGTMNTAEYTTFRLPRNSAGQYDLVNGASQETGVASANPVNNLACGVSGSRYSVVGTGEEVNAVNGLPPAPAGDSIGYTFFSYGNVNQIANLSNFGYLSINGVDPIFAVYGSTYDPGQPATAGTLPGTANLPVACASNFPCGEAKIWKGGLSFPNLRNGAYRQWAMIRLIADTGSTALANAKTLITSAQASAVTTTPDFVPAVAVTGTTDPGLVLIHSHYTGLNSPAITPNNATDAGSEEGGCIINRGSLATKLVQRSGGCAVGP